MNIWVAGKDLMKHHCLIKKQFIVIYIEKSLKILITNIQKECENT